MGSRWEPGPKLLNMELTTFETDLIEAYRAYDATLDPQELCDSAEAIMRVILKRFHHDGLDSVWYGRLLDRQNDAAYFTSHRYADDCTFYGLVRLLSEWADNTNPKCVRVDS